MNLTFDNPKHEALINDADALSKKFRGDADEILAAVEVLRAANSLNDVPRSYRPHPLKAAYKGFFAIDVTRTHRIIFKPDHEGDLNYRIDNYKSITSVTIVEIYKDYH